MMTGNFFPGRPGPDGFPKTLLPGGANAGAYRESLVTADLPMPVSR